MPQDRGGLRVVFDRDDSSRDSVTEYSIESSFMTPTDGFRFTLYDEDIEKLRGLELQPVTLVVDDRPIVVGRIETTRIGGNGTAIECSGRDYLSELCESHVDPSLKIKEGMTVIDAIALAVAPCGITTVLAETDVALRNLRTGRNIATKKTPSGFKTAQLTDYKPNPGEGIAQFCARILARHGVTLQPADRRSAVVLAAPQYTQSPTYRLRRFRDPDKARANNVLDSEATRDYSHVPSLTLFTGKGADTGAGVNRVKIEYDMATLADALGGEIAEILSDTIIPGRILPTNAAAFGLGQLYRLHYTKDQDSKTKAQLEQVAKRQLAEHLKETLRYSATVQGHTDPESGATWAVDTLVEVNDDICGLHETLWIENVHYSYSSSQGATTRLECWRPNSFQIGE